LQNQNTKRSYARAQVADHHHQFTVVAVHHDTGNR
jgi:hypothetical protein